MLHGIDVSAWQDETYSVSGLDFVFVKGTEGTGYTNPKQKTEAARARKSGLAVGFYHFLHPGHIWAQASYFVEECDSEAGDMLVVDWETVGGPHGHYASCEEKDQFLRIVKELRPHHRVGLYCNVDFWKNHDTTSGCGDFLWIASPGVSHPPIRHPWLFWQTGEARGVDQDVCAFHTRAALRDWCGYTS
jgi:GH25 family lysozyme M1 (1,4-beta-N-acetylmuramidase)